MLMHISHACRACCLRIPAGPSQTTTPPTPVAVKAVTRNKLTTKLLENLDSEIRLLKGIKQRNVVELIECMVSAPRPDDDDPPDSMVACFAR